jgi:hypothetical protein
MDDLNANDLEEASKIIAGSARSMGIEVKEWWFQRDTKNYLKKPMNWLLA